MKRMALLLLAACLAGSAWGGALPDAGVSVQQLSEEGRALYNSGKLDKAFGRFEKLLELDPKSLVASHYLARIHAVRGEFEAAINIIRALQEGGISIYRSQDSKTTLNTVINGILAVEDLKKRANHLVHFRETLRGLPASVDRRIDAHLMSIYAKLGQTQHHEIVKGRYFRSKVDAAQVFFTAGRTYLEYGVKMPDAATYFEQAADALQAQARKLEPSGNRATDALRRRLILAEASVAEDFLAYTYNAAGMQRSEKNRFAAREARPGATFMDVTAPSGIKPMPAPRVAIGDYDGDGRQDLAVRGRIYRNEDGKVFTDVTAKLGIDPRGVITSLWLDYNNDGHLDFLCGGMPRLRLWRNRGDGAFVNATLPAALGFPLAGIPEALAAADYDADGDLDLFVGCFEHPKQTAQGQANRLLRNKGAGRFEDVSEAAGLYPTETVKDLRTGADVKHVPHYCSRGASWADYNNDGRLDLYVANYRLHPNRLWTGRGDGAFVDRAEAMGVRGLPGPDRYAGAYGHSIACAWGDIDNDGDLDLVVTDISIGRFLMFADTTSVYVNQGAGETWRFKDAFDDSGIRFQEMSTGVSLCDYDNDGDLDLYRSAIYKERPTALYQNAGKRRFEPVTWRAGVVAFGSWGHAWFDKDNDGDMDLVVAGANDVLLFENQGSANAWLRVKLVGAESNRHGVGARVYVDGETHHMLREVRVDTGTAGQASSILHFGLGVEKGPVKVTVRWPSGAKQVLEGVKANQLLVVEEK